jgi:hypothetical protein
MARCICESGGWQKHAVGKKLLKGILTHLWLCAAFIWALPSKKRHAEKNADS